MFSISDEEAWVKTGSLRSSILNTPQFGDNILKLFNPDREGWVKNGFPCRNTWNDIFLVGLQILEETSAKSK